MALLRKFEQKFQTKSNEPVYLKEVVVTTDSFIDVGWKIPSKTFSKADMVPFVLLITLVVSSDVAVTSQNPTMFRNKQKEFFRKKTFK